jgi:hypothetical protein
MSQVNATISRKNVIFYNNILISHLGKSNGFHSLLKRNHPTRLDLPGSRILNGSRLGHATGLFTILKFIPLILNWPIFNCLCLLSNSGRCSSICNRILGRAAILYVSNGWFLLQPMECKMHVSHQPQPIIAGATPVMFEQGRRKEQHIQPIGSNWELRGDTSKRITIGRRLREMNYRVGRRNWVGVRGNATVSECVQWVALEIKGPA